MVIVTVDVAVSSIVPTSNSAPRTLATAVFLIQPRAASAAVTVYRLPMQSTWAPGTRVVAGQLTDASIGSLTASDLSVTLPVFVTRNVNVTWSPAETGSVASAFLVNVRSGFWTSRVLTVPSAETVASNGPAPVTVAVLISVPASRSACVSPYTPVHVIAPSGASVVVGQETSPMRGSATTSPVRVTLPVFVTRNVYGTSPPVSIVVGLPAVLTIATDGFWTSVVSSVSVAVASSPRSAGSPDGGLPYAAAVFWM